VTNGLAQSNPVKEFRLRQTQRQPQKTVLTQEQSRQLLRHVAGDRLEALWWLGVNLGLRIGEALGLTWDAVDLDKRLIVIKAQTQRVKDFSTGKTRLTTGQPPKSATSNRPIRLSATLASKLREHKQRQEVERVAAQRWEDHNLVFCTRHGRPLDSPNVTKYLAGHLEAAGLPRVTFHGLRHTANSLLSAQGVSLKARQAMLGHSNPRLTEALYTHAMPVELDAIADTLERTYGE
jgi:integrase